MVKSEMYEKRKMSRTIVSRKRQELYRYARYNMTMFTAWFTAESGRMAICHERCHAHGTIEPYRRNCSGSAGIQVGFPGRERFCDRLRKVRALSGSGTGWRQGGRNGVADGIQNGDRLHGGASA